MREMKLTGSSRVGKSYWGAVRASWPLVSLRVKEEEIVLKVLTKTRHFPKEKITRLSRHKEPLGTSLRIEHNIEAIPPYVLFGTSNYEALSKVLHELGYPIVDNDKNVD